MLDPDYGWSLLAGAAAVLCFAMAGRLMGTKERR